MIYDCFTFFNELDLLEIRLHTLKDLVDRFVIVEATLTHQGKPKPLYFKENANRFLEFNNKITHIVVDSYPLNPQNSSWVYEHHQRNCIMKGLANCQPDDLIIISDIDEIPSPESINKLHTSTDLVIFRQKMYYYYINCLNNTNGYRWNGSVMTQYRRLRSPQDCREISMRLLGLGHQKPLHRLFWKLWKFYKFTLRGYKIKFIENGGWHFSYLGGADAIIRKIEAFAHSEYNKDDFKEVKKLEERINNGLDIFDRGFSYTFVKLDDSFPRYITENKNRFAHLIKLN